VIAAWLRCGLKANKDKKLDIRIIVVSGTTRKDKKEKKKRKRDADEDDGNG
jgi:hypothetical protein